MSRIIFTKEPPLREKDDLIPEDQNEIPENKYCTRPFPKTQTLKDDLVTLSLSEPTISRLLT